MNTKLVVLRNGKPLFEYPIELDADVGLAVGATMALSEFRRFNPTISLLDPEISIRFENSSELHCLTAWQQEHEIDKGIAHSRERRVKGQAPNQSAIPLPALASVLGLATR
jgi:hypothetical protein